MTAHQAPPSLGFARPNFRIKVVAEADAVELCGALKNIVAVGAGFCDGLHCGDNTKAAVIRLGLMDRQQQLELDMEQKTGSK